MAALPPELLIYTLNGGLAICESQLSQERRAFQPGFAAAPSAPQRQIFACDADCDGAVTGLGTTLLSPTATRLSSSTELRTVAGVPLAEEIPAPVPDKHTSILAT
jgi:hypothetical protein